MNLGRASIFEIDPVLSVGGLFSRRDIVTAALTSRQGCAALHRDAAAEYLGRRRSSRSIPFSASEVSPRDVKSLPLLRPRVRAALLVTVPPLRQTWEGVDSEIDPALSVGGLTSRRESW